MLGRTILFLGLLLFLSVLSIAFFRLYGDDAVRILISGDEQKTRMFIANINDIAEGAWENIQETLQTIEDEGVLSADRSQKAIQTGLDASQRATLALSKLAAEAPPLRNREARLALRQNCANIAWAFSFEEELYTALQNPDEDDTDAELIEHVASNTKKMDIFIAHAFRNLARTKEIVGTKQYFRPWAFLERFFWNK